MLRRLSKGSSIQLSFRHLPSSATFFASSAPVVTSLQGSDAEHIYETIYCARGQAENLIKQHKAQLSSDRTSCRSPLANQMRLILHTGAYWLLLDLRAAIPSWNPLRHTEFATIRLRLLKIASRSRDRYHPGSLSAKCEECDTSRRERVTRHTTVLKGIDRGRFGFGSLPSRNPLLSSQALDLAENSALRPL